MIIRNGFVSNSSSTSFCILGMVYGSKSDFKNKESLLEDSDFTIEYGLGSYSDDDVFVGVSVDDLDQDKTITQHKIEIASKLSKILNEDISMNKIYFIIDGGYDG